MITIPMHTFITIVVLAVVITLITVYFAGKYAMLTSRWDMLEDEIEGALEEEKSHDPKSHWTESLQYSLRQVRLYRVLKLDTKGDYYVD